MFSFLPLKDAFPIEVQYIEKLGGETEEIELQFAKCKVQISSSNNQNKRFSNLETPVLTFDCKIFNRWNAGYDFNIFEHAKYLDVLYEKNANKTLTRMIILDVQDALQFAGDIAHVHLTLSKPYLDRGYDKR